MQYNKLKSSEKQSTFPSPLFNEDSTLNSFISLYLDRNSTRKINRIWLPSLPKWRNWIFGFCKLLKNRGLQGWNFALKKFAKQFVKHFWIHFSSNRALSGYNKGFERGGYGPVFYKFVKHLLNTLIVSDLHVFLRKIKKVTKSSIFTISSEAQILKESV